MELKDQVAGCENPVVEVTVRVFGERICPKQFRVPATARSYIAYGDEGLRLNARFVHRQAQVCSVSSQRRFFAKALPDADFKYFSNANA